MIADKDGKREKRASAANQPAPSTLYDPLEFVVARAPLLPVESYARFCAKPFDDESLHEILADGRIVAAINAASPALMTALLSPSTNRSDRERAKRKLRRYLIRMSTRPTPFGALAGVGIAKLGAQSTLRLDDQAVRYCAHLDVPWLLEFAHMLESDPDIFRQLKLLANPCALQRGGRVYIRELNPLCREKKAVTSASLKATRVVLRALEAAAAPIAYDNLVACLGGLSKANEEKIHRFITELWRQEFLLTELRPPFTQGDPSRYLIERLEGIRGGEPYLSELEQYLARAGRVGLSTHASASDDRPEEPPETNEHPPRIHISSVLPVTGELNAAIAREAARAVDILLSLTPWPNGLNYIAAYRQVFEERYGTDREVPLLEMVDPEYGIGFPPVYDGKKSQPNPEQNQAQRIRRETLFDIANTANVERRLEVELDEGTLKRLQTWTPDARNIPTSLEVNVFVDAQSAQELDNGHFSIVVGPNVGAMQAGRSLGRFAEFLGPDGTRAYTRAAQAHQASCRGRLPVELNYLSRRPPLTNILVRPSAQQYEISVGLQAGVPPSQSIAVSDLMVGVRGGRFYVRSLRLNRILDVCCGHMANIDFAPSICRLLAELMHDGIAMLRDFDWNVAFMHPFLPRVRVGRIVLSVAKWRITERTVARYLRLGSHEAFRTSLEQWRNVWMVPRHVYLADGDNRLVLDLDNDMDIEDLRTEIRHLAENSALTLEEVYPSVADSWLQGSNGKYVAEYVVPLAPRARIVSEPASVSQPRGLDAIAVAPLVVAARRLKTPGSDWLYIKLYVSPSLEEDLLLGTIREFAGEARSSAIVQKWFFVRYADPQPHIRLRYQGTPGALSESLLPRVLSWAQDLVNRDLCLRFSIDTYEPEIERYGGIDSIDLAEEFFAIDSDVTMALLPFLGEQALRRVELAVFGLHYLFGKFGWSVNQRRELFRSMSAPREESGPAYRERKEVIQALIGMRDASPVSKVAAVMARTLESTAAAIEDVGWRFRALDEEGRLTPPLHLISRSLAHMHCNRLGLDRSTERLAYGLLERGYDSMEALAKHGGFRRDAVSDAACGRNEVRSTHSQESN